VIYFFYSAYIEVAKAVEVHIAAVVSKDIGHLLTILVDFSLKVLHGPLVHIADVIVTIDVIGIIPKFDFTVHPTIECTHKNIVKSSTVVIANNRLAIVERILFVAQLIYSDGIN
jgi:hypothetical protein